MAKFLCRCGAVIHTSGPIPHPDELYLISGEAYDRRADASDFNLILESTGVHRCRACGRLWVFWDGWENDPVSYRPEEAGSDSPAIRRLLERLPEFRPPLEQFVAGEPGGFDAFSAISELARWALPSRDETLLRRVFAAVDEVYADQSLRDGGFLAIEFFEIVCAAGRARFDPYLGTTSREWFDRHCA